MDNEEDGSIDDWTEEQQARLKRRYVGHEEDFTKLLEYVMKTWAAQQLDAMEANDQFITWDSYFCRDKVLRNIAAQLQNTLTSEWQE